MALAFCKHYRTVAGEKFGEFGDLLRIRQFYPPIAI